MVHTLLISFLTAAHTELLFCFPFIIFSVPQHGCAVIHTPSPFWVENYVGSSLLLLQTMLQGTCGLKGFLIMEFWGQRG